MRNLKALLRLLGAVSLTTVATTSVVACDKTTLSTFEAEYKPAVAATFGWGEKLSFKKETFGNGYFFSWNDEQSGKIACIVIDTNEDAISKIDKFLNVTPYTRPIIFIDQMEKSLSKIKLFASREIGDPKVKGKVYIVEKIEIIE